MYAIRFYRVFDTGDESDLEALQAALAAAGTPARASFTRVNPKSIWIEHPPLLVSLPPVTATTGNGSYLVTAVARVYEIGAISLCFVLEDTSAAPSAILPVALSFAGPARSTRTSTRTTRSISSTATTRPSIRSHSSRARRSPSRPRRARTFSATPSRTLPTTGPSSPGTRPSSSRPSRRRTWSR